ncbi:MAG TPA: queuosine precursor transporter [Bryobacteraceae bacterium]|nr:queuosine precursor transporter [Bryobacteraceae bacterium]
MSLFTSEKPAPVQARDLRTYRHFDLLLAIFLVVLLISNLVGQKLCLIFGRVISGAQLLFPLTYIFGDVFTEVYGYAASRRAIWLGFIANGLLALMGLITVWLPPAPGWHHQEAFATVFYQIPRLIVASLVAYWCGEFTNSYTLAKMKLWTRGKMLWSRTVGSTVTGQFVDTMLLVAIGFAGTAPVGTLFNFFVTSYMGKVLYEVIATPATYAVVAFLKRTEGLDAFDYKSDFNPFHTGTNG